MTENNLTGFSHRFYMILIFFAGSFLRLYDLGTKSLWRDEIETMLFALASFKEIIRRALEIPFIPIPPLYFHITHFFLKIETSPFFLRLPAALSSLISLFLLYYLASRWLNRRVALLSVYLLAISPFQIYYAQEARSYSFLMMLCLASMIFLEKSLNDGLIWFIPWAAACLATLYTHHFGIIIFSVESLLFLYFLLNAGYSRRLSRKLFFSAFIISLSAVLLLWKPMLAHLILGMTGSRGVKGISMIPPFSLLEVKTMIGLVGLGNHTGTLIVPFLALIGLLSFKGQEKRALIVSLFFLLPAGAITLFGRFGHVFRVRYLIFVIPFYLLMTARGSQTLDDLIGGVLYRLTRKKVFTGSMPLFTVFLMIAAIAWTYPYYSSYYKEEKQNWKATAAFINKAAGDEHLVVVSGRGDETNIRRFILDYYGSLGPRTTILHMTDNYRNELRNLLNEGRPLWYIGTEPGRPLARFDKRFFEQNPDLLDETDYTVLPPIYIGTNRGLGTLEAKFLAQARFKPIRITPVFPGKLTEEEMSRQSRRLLKLVDSIPRSYLEVDPAIRFPEENIL